MTIPRIGPLQRCEATRQDGEPCPEVASHRVRILDAPFVFCCECAGVLVKAGAQHVEWLDRPRVA